MARKTEIKVYLPERLVGELEGRKRMGTRSKFIEQAINSKLRKHEGLMIEELDSVMLLCNIRDRFQTKPFIHDLIQLLINEVNK